MKLYPTRHSHLLFFSLLGGTLVMPAAQADFYFGGSLGTATVALEPQDADFDEDDNSWKVFGGYLFDLPAVNFGIEGGYMDLGSPANELGSIDATAIDVFAIAGLDFSVVGVFGKAGLVAWDSDIDTGGFQSSDDGTDPAYGVGLKFAVASVAVRLEYELFDIEDTDDVNLISVGLAWHF